MIYLDNAATSCPKPPEVVEAVAQALTDVCANPSRGAYDPARRVLVDKGLRRPTNYRCRPPATSCARDRQWQRCSTSRTCRG